MTVSSETAKVEYTGDGSTTTFPVPFYFLADSHLKVVTLNNNVETILVLSVDYTVSGAGNSSGGSITTTTAPLAGVQVTIVRNVPLTQETDYQPNDPFPAASHEEALDKLTMEVQQLNEELTRTITLPISAIADTELPMPEASSVIAWNQDGYALENVPLSEIVNTAVAGYARADIFSGNGSATAFTLTSNPGSQANLDVSISGVTQKPGIDYTWTSGTTITFTTAPPNASNNILVRYTVALPAASTEIADNLAGGDIGYVPYQSATDVTSFIAPGVPGHFLMTYGPGLPPGWLPTPPAADILGGVANQIPYQTAPDTTSFLPTGTAGQVLVSGGSGSAPSWQTNSSGAFIDVAALYPGLGLTSDAIQQAIDDYPGRTIYLRGGAVNAPTYPNIWYVDAPINIYTACSIVGDGELTVLAPTSAVMAGLPMISVNCSKAVTLNNFQILGNHVSNIGGIQLGKGYSISGLSWASGNVTLTTSSPHNVPVGEYIRLVVKGASPSGYNTQGIWATSTGSSAMTYAVASNPGAATIMGSMAIENEASRISKLNILACSTGVYSYQAGLWSITDCYLHDCDFAGVYLANTLEPDHGDCSIMGCEFGCYGTTGFGIYQTGLGGIRIVNNKFINGSDHWHVTPASGDPINDAFFVGNSTENAAGDHIHIDGTNGFPNNFVISNNQIGLDGVKTSITGINIIGTSVNAPTQMVISDNTIWVHGSSQTGINVNAGGYDQYAYCTIYVAKNNLYQWGQSTNPAASDYRTGQTGIAIQGTASVRLGTNNINGNWANRLITSSASQCRYDAGQTQNATLTLNNGAVAPVGTFFATGWQAVTFPFAFPQAPIVNAIISGSNTAGAITLLIQNVTTTGFDLGAFCINNFGNVVVSWNAAVKGN